MLVTFEVYEGEPVSLNPSQVKAVTSYQHFDHGMVLPPSMYIRNGDGLLEVDAKQRAEADRLRTSPRTLVLTSTASFIVKGTVEEVQRVLANGGR